ncbi:la protein 1-like [Rutidosis leptorrhynchoides]|uniref:la protein 1-like n=1 Tax=Rutidosis leptorrhynchoides TaxID=125765 RepID=UPI003A993744
MVATQLDEETVKKIIRQVEFYFSESNLPKDNFLKNTVSESEDGMVSLALICSFSRMRLHLGLGDIKPEDVSEDTVEAVAEILKAKSTTLKISEDGKKVGRTTELPKAEEVIEQLDSRTIAASPICYDIKLEEVESFFAQSAKVNSVRLPRHVADKRVFCGTALVEFSSEEDATKILTQSLVFNGADLELKPKKEFDEQRAIDEEAESIRREKLSNRKNGSQEEEYPKGLLVAFKLKSNTPKSDNQELVVEVTEGESEPKVEVKSSSEQDEEIDEEKTETKKTSADMYKDNKDVVLREDLKSVFQKFGNVKYIDFKMGEESGYIRFEEADGAQKARTAGALTDEGGLIVKNYVAILDPVTGEAEKEYWNMLRSQEKFRGNKGNWSRGGGKNNRGGRQFNGKHNRSRDNNNNSGNRNNKSQKVAAA